MYSFNENDTIVDIIYVAHLISMRDDPLTKYRVGHGTVKRDTYHTVQIKHFELKLNAAVPEELSWVSIAIFNWWKLCRADTLLIV